MLTWIGFFSKYVLVSSVEIFPVSRQYFQILGKTVDKASCQFWLLDATLHNLFCGRLDAHILPIRQLQDLQLSQPYLSNLLIHGQFSWCVVKTSIGFLQHQRQAIVE